MDYSTILLIVMTIGRVNFAFESDILQGRLGYKVENGVGFSYTAEERILLFCIDNIFVILDQIRCNTWRRFSDDI